MSKVPAFFSFHYDNDVFRVQQVRNIGVIEDNAAVNPSEWESVKKGGEKAIKNWIDATMSNRRCVIVLVGAETANRKYVQYEIEKAYRDKRALFGIHINNLKDPKKGTSAQGPNPFAFMRVDGKSLAHIPCYIPSYLNPYNEIAGNMTSWVQTALAAPR